jgi:SPP1 family predicted phage head-tail adaptor
MASSLKAGSLDRRVTLCEQRHTKDAHGGAVTRLYPLATVWARVVPLAGRLLDADSQQRTAESDTEFAIRYRAGVDQSTVVVYRDEAYDLQHCGEIGRREGLQLRGRRTQPQPDVPHPLADFDGPLLVDFDGGQLLTL